MKIKSLHICLFLLSLILVSCKSDNNITKKSRFELVERQNESNKNLNISFLLDLSDRINPEKYPNQSMEYYKRDVAYIESVSNAFIEHLETKKVRQMDDKIQLYFDPEPQNQNINSLSSSLRFHINRNNVSLEKLQKIKESYSKKPLDIYELAIRDDDYIGSNTWRFFKTKVKDYCIEENRRNILVILTDGYIFHQDSKIQEDNKTSYLIPQLVRKLGLNNDNWRSKIEKQGHGFIVEVNDLSNLEILVLGINADKKNPYEEDVIIKYWEDWFDNMKVKKYEIKTSALPSNMNKIINEFILND